MTSRLDTLDGLRGAAAFLVVIYHFFVGLAEPVHSPTLYPHGSLLRAVPFAQVFGDVGVLLFFLVSGFVIMMTLERSSGLVDFATRRTLRLWPAMIVCAALSAILQNTWGDLYHYAGSDTDVTLFEYISSVLFFPPPLAASYLGLENEGVYWVEGVYWTLWHEVRFYTLIALVFLIVPRNRFLWVWAVVQAISVGVEFLNAFQDSPYPLQFAARLLFQPGFLCWFSLGLCSYFFWSGRREPALFVITVLAGLALVVPELIVIGPDGIGLAEDIGLRLAAYAMIFTPFMLFLSGGRFLGLLRTRPFVVIGLASYPLYLFHEDPGMIAIMFGNSLGLPPVLTALSVLLMVIVFAILIHFLVEQPVQAKLKHELRLWSHAVEKRLPILRFSNPVSNGTHNGAEAVDIAAKGRHKSLACQGYSATIRARTTATAAASKHDRT